jgi:dTDP-4-amino-4,6-dideoxygalactose transaminase
MQDDLAIAGGAPVSRQALPTWPVFAPDEIEAVSQVLASGKVNYWTGEQCRQVEAEFATYHDRRYAISLTNGTAALELALYALGVGPGDEVIVPSRTFIASASCVALRGAVPVVADVDPDSQNLTADSISAMLTPRTRAVVVVHHAGWPCEMDDIMAVANAHGLFVIEDCAQAHGARYRGRLVGSFGHCAAFSFCQDKIMSTGGEGGMLLIDDVDLWKKAWAFKDHGKNVDLAFSPGQGAGFRWLHESFGTNLRMTEPQAAIGRRQLTKLADWVGRRRRNLEILNVALGREELLRVPLVPDHMEHAGYRFYAFLRSERLTAGWDRLRILRAIEAEGIPCFTGSCPEIYREGAFVNAGLGRRQPLPVASILGETSLAFLLHPTLGESDIADTARAVVKVMRQALVGA